MGDLQIATTSGTFATPTVLPVNEGGAIVRGEETASMGGDQNNATVSLQNSTEAFQFVNDVVRVLADQANIDAFSALNLLISTALAIREQATAVNSAVYEP